MLLWPVCWPWYAPWVTMLVAHDIAWAPARAVWGEQVDPLRWRRTERSA